MLDVRNSEQKVRTAVVVLNWQGEKLIRDCLDALRAQEYKDFLTVVADNASTDASVEIMVTDLSLDCRESGKRTARAAVCVDVVKTGRGPRTVALSADGASEADAASGDFSAAFSKAFNEALAEALKLLK